MHTTRSLTRLRFPHRLAAITVSIAAGLVAALLASRGGA